MKIAVISDIHGNLYALREVLEDIDNQNVDSIICLGDLVGYGPHPNEVIALIRNRNILCLKGNYDASVVDNDYTYIRDTDINSFSLPWTVEELRTSNRYYLDNLPDNFSMNVCGKSIKFVHGSPRKINEYLKEDYSKLDEVMAELKEDVLVCAHTHIPYAKKIGDKVIINDGSVGKPKNGTPNATYVILDFSNEFKLKVETKTVPYEFKRTMKDMELKNFPQKLIYSYEFGKE